MTGMSSYLGRDLEAMAFARNYSRWIADAFRPWLGGTVLEVGAGSGTFAALLAESRLDALHAIEPSAEMYPMLAARFADTPRVVTAQATLAEWRSTNAARYDAIVYNNVLEHVEDDRAELACVREALAPGAALCLFVPALPWLMSDFDRSIGHYRRYTRRGLGDLLAAAGLSVERLHYVDLAGILPWLVSMRWLRGGLDRRKVALYDGIAIPVVRRLEALMRPPIGRNLVAVAIRRD